MGDREAEVSLRAAMAVGARIAGVDLLYRVPTRHTIDGSDPEPYVWRSNESPVGRRSGMRPVSTWRTA